MGSLTLVRATATMIPDNTNGTAVNSVRANIVRSCRGSAQEKADAGRSEMVSRWDAGIETPKARAWKPMAFEALDSVKAAGRKYTSSAPAVMPSMATLIAKNPRWYHVMTLKIRVSRISSVRVTSVVMNRPVRQAGCRMHLPVPSLVSVGMPGFDPSD
jgi:hypothetical protein